MKTLIADDDGIARRILRAALTRWGYEVVEATNGEEALEQLRGPTAPELAVLDWVMPGLSGPEVCRILKSRARKPDPYVILLTAKTHWKDVVAGLESGADDYVTKPYQVEELRARVAVGRRLRSLQEELVHLNEELESRVSDRTERIRRLLDLDQEMFEKLGHDMRTPLTPLKALLPILVEDEPDTARRESLALCLGQVRDLDRLAKRVADLGRLESHRTSMVFGPVRLAAVAEAALSHLESRGVKTNTGDGRTRVVVNVPAEMEVHGDVSWLQRVLEDLLDNALRFSPEDVPASLDAETEGDKVLVAVTDRGCGIDPAHVDRIFDPFFTGDPARSRRCASGIGLSICRRVIERHGGRIWAESDGTGNGTRIRFSLPRAPTTESAGKEQEVR